MKFKLARTAAAVATATLGLIVVQATTVQAATVPNFFWRTCTIGTWGCTAWSQSNPPYVSSVPSICYTKNLFGRVVSQYTVAAGRKC